VKNFFRFTFTGARLYVPELTWMFFLRYLDIMERKEEQKAAALGTSFQRTLNPPYRAPRIYRFEIIRRDA